MGTCEHAGWPAGDPRLPEVRETPPPPLEVDWLSGPPLDRLGELVVRLRGEIDLATWDLLSATLAEAVAVGAGTVVLDASGVAFCDVRGIQILTDAGRRLRAEGRALVLREPQPVLVRLVELVDPGPCIAIDANDWS
jgi:anti-anti-sigma factor